MNYALKEYKYVPEPDNRQLKFRICLILTVLYAIGIFILSSMNNPVEYFTGLL